MKKAFILLIVLLELVCHTGNAQLYKFQQYGIDKGLCHQFIYAVNQDKHGFIWFATGLGLCRYDGFKFTSPEGNLPATNVTAAFKDSDGDLWFGYNDGLVVEYDGANFSVADTSISNTVVNQITQASKGEILVAAQTGGITRITGKRVERLTEGMEEMMINAICFAADNKLLVGCQDGLLLFNYQNDLPKLNILGKSDLLLGFNIRSIIPQANGGGYWVATESDGIFNVTVNGDDLSAVPLSITGLEDAQVQSIYEDSQNDLWISTFGKGLFRAEFSQDKLVERVYNYNSTNGLGSDYIKQVFFDNQQNLWVGTYGQGVASITNLAFSFFETLSPIASNATAVLSVDDSEYWIAGTGSIIRMITKPESKTTILGRANGVPNERITALHIDEAGDLWIGTERSGVFKLGKDAKTVTPFYREENSLSNTIQAITSLDGQLWIASRNGVLVLDAKTAKKTGQYTMFDGGLPHNNIRDIYKDSKNRIWIATNSNSLVAVNKDQKLTLADEMETEFSCITEDDQGRLWAGTAGINGKGVYLFDEVKDTVYHFISEDGGLKSDYCYAITFDGNGHVWVGHRLGLTCINTKRLTTTIFGKENGIYGDVNPNAMKLNKSGEMLVGMTDGVMMYDIKADHTQDQMPMLNLSKVTINDDSYNPYKSITLPYGRYKVEFDFIGLQYSNPGSVTYQYLLQGYDNNWTKPSKNNMASYPRLEEGEYDFWVKACNSDNCTEELMLFTIKIRNPFWKTWWFVLLVTIAIVGLGYVVIAIRERNHRIQQEYLERELAQRTKEVRTQKEEIEVKNRDITDSINYAQRIQFSVFPSTSTLLEHCSGAFIFYRPRDIVSGDFYWFDFFPETNRLLIVCADSTGHGVPGAFMSLIGTTLIKDIALRPEVISPADILYRLDENIQSTLNQNTDSEQANDGMDIIVCEINTQTHHTRISSAMRPFIVYHDGVPTTYKSSRSSIGGQAVENKTFETTEVQLSVGDTIYMFTDGYTDQFGGPSGKKFKMNRLQSILDDIHSRDMDEQHRVIKENFDLWKGQDKQIDDVLMIGVRI